MTVDDDSKGFRRRDHTRRQYRLSNLPYALDASLIDDELPNLDKSRGLGRILVELARAAQGNFDHVGQEMKRFATLYNESEADSAYLKDLLDPHDHEGRMNDTMRPEDWDYGAVIFENFKVGTIIYDNTDVLTTTDVVLTPVWVGSNTYVDQLQLALGNDGAGTYLIRLGLYDSDGSGNLPRSLVVDGGTVGAVGTTGAFTNVIAVDVSVDLRGGRWYWLAAKVDDATGAAPTYIAYSTAEDVSQNFPPFNSWWPFPNLDNVGSSTTGILAYSFPHATGAFTSTLDINDLTYGYTTPAMHLRAG